MKVQSLIVLTCTIGLGHSYPDTTGGVGVTHGNLVGVSHSSPLSLARGPALISVPQSQAQVLPSRVSGVIGARPLVTGAGPVPGGVRPVVTTNVVSRPVPAVTNIVARPSGGAIGPAFSSRPLGGQTILPSAVAGPAIGALPLHSSVLNNNLPAGVNIHPATHNVGPAQPTQEVHHAVHNAPVVQHTATEVHHSSHGDGGYEGGYDEKPDPFHFEYGVHDDKYYTDFSEVRTGDEYGNIVGEYQVALPDGRIQYVKYTADGNYGGTTMEVTYKGEARHPDSHPIVETVSHDVSHIDSSRVF